MMTELAETASEYYENKEQLRNKQRELSELRAELFGTDSPEVEEKARALFSEAGAGGSGGRLEKIDELRTEIERIESDLTELETELRGEFAEMRLPFAETIDTRDDSIAFPFSDPIPEGVIRGAEEVLDYDIENTSVEFRTDEIVSQEEEIGDAITDVKEFVADVRRSAREELDIDEEIKEDKSYSILG